MFELAELLFICENLAASVVHIKIHFVSERKLFQDFTELLQLIEKPDSSAAIEIVGFYEPDVCAIVHLFT